ncbi:bifunctional 2-polyprenyl-6-hydroxyphenol methylase/3-demethylubiquinol 3-O-methyltransferase UbiG [Streptomyces sp. WMMB 322]|uniref:class I SAM-dependent methyltransferase n=1 Tax=Streptomyces sp. WMMB 322 TaxID=1286821 RepID=UPI00082387AC|nr:class I SAM-dependent methyltransferase [Streptomyces sp. WMMB 322]SCK54784.1 Methyltransferase domain-containing protein [Streptomyces sp. WMMB 322]
MAAPPPRRQAVPTGRGPLPRPRVAGGGPPATRRSPQSFSVRFFGAGLAAAELMTCYLGLEIGAYHALADSGPATAAELARRAGLDERMAREWLEQQASAGILQVEDPEQAPEQRRFTLPPEHAEALLDPDSPNWIAPLVVMPIGGMASVLPQLVAAYRNREGLAPSAYGRAMRDGQANLNRGVFQHQLAGWISRHLPDIEARLHVPGAAITDVACGSGLSTLELARAFPLARVHGVDLDPASVDAARRRLAETDLGDRVSFGSGDAAGSGRGADGPGAAGAGEGSLLVCVFDALHDMSRPVEVLRACREMLAPGGAVLLMEPSVAERFTAEPDDTERFHYAVSVLHCLPVGMSDTPSAATGTVMRPDTVRAYAREAGLEAEVIDVGHLFYRLYRLRAA